MGVLALPAMAWMAVVRPTLGRLLFGRPVDGYLLPLAVVMALSCFCSVLGAILNGVGRQGTVASVSLLGGGVQLALTLVLVPLPGVGMGGYVVGALVSAGLEALLCLVLTLRHTGLALRPLPWLIAPGLGRPVISPDHGPAPAQITGLAAWGPCPAPGPVWSSEWCSIWPPSVPRGGAPAHLPAAG